MNAAKKESNLIKIAAEMQAYAIDHPRLTSLDSIAPYRRQLTGGLRLVLYIKPDHTWRLSLYRPLVYPAPSEIQVVKRDFGIPATVKESQERIDDWFIVRLEWQELAQGKLFDLQPIETYYREE